MKAVAVFFAFLIVSLNGQYVLPGVYPPRFFQPAPFVAAAPVLAAPPPPPVFAAPIIPRPVVAAAPVFLPPPVVAAPVFAAPVIPRPVIAAAPALVPAFAPFARAAYLIGSNKGKAAAAKKN